MTNHKEQEEHEEEVKAHYSQYQTERSEKHNQMIKVEGRGDQSDRDGVGLLTSNQSEQIENNPLKQGNTDYTQSPMEKFQKGQMVLVENKAEKGMIDVPGNTEATGTMVTLEAERTDSKKAKKTLQREIGPPISIASSQSNP